MSVATVQFYDVIVWLHVTAVVLAFGPTFSYGLFFATAGKTNPWRCRRLVASSSPGAASPLAWVCWSSLRQAST